MTTNRKGILPKKRRMAKKKMIRKRRPSRMRKRTLIARKIKINRIRNNQMASPPKETASRLVTFSST